ATSRYIGGDHGSPRSRCLKQAFGQAFTIRRQHGNMSASIQISNIIAFPPPVNEAGLMPSLDLLGADTGRITRIRPPYEPPLAIMALGLKQTRCLNKLLHPLVAQ